MSVPALQTLFTAVAAGLIVFWLTVAVWPQRRVDAGPVLIVLRYGRAWRLLGLIIALAIPTLMAVIVWKTAWPRASTLILAGSVLTGLGILGGVLLLEAERVVITATEAGLTANSPWRRRRFVPWADVECVSYSSLNCWHVLYARDSTTIRASIFLTGKPRLLMLLRERSHASL